MLTHTRFKTASREKSATFPYFPMFSNQASTTILHSRERVVVKLEVWYNWKTKFITLHFKRVRHWLKRLHHYTPNTALNTAHNEGKHIKCLHPPLEGNNASALPNLCSSTVSRTLPFSPTAMV